MKPSLPSDRAWPMASKRPLRNAVGVKIYIMIMLVLLGLMHAVLLFNLTKYLHDIF